MTPGVSIPYKPTRFGVSLLLTGRDPQPELPCQSCIQQRRCRVMKKSPRKASDAPCKGGFRTDGGTPGYRDTARRTVGLWAKVGWFPLHYLPRRRGSQVKTGLGSRVLGLWSLTFSLWRRSLIIDFAFGMRFRQPKEDPRPKLKDPRPKVKSRSYSFRCDARQHEKPIVCGTARDIARKQ